jgi:glycosyltransferase involved in cell wall biosynthesis
MFSSDTISIRNNNPGRSHIFQIDEDYSPSHAGITTVVAQLSGYLAGQGIPTTILTAGEGSKPTAAGVDLVKFPLSRFGRRWRYPVGMKAYLKEVARTPGALFHLHGPWCAPQWLGSLTARRFRVPALLSPHSALEPWFWHYGSIQRLRYQAYWRLLAYPVFRHLAIIHAITATERDNLAKLFPGQRLELIHNAINLAEADEALATANSEPTLETSCRYLLFLGQLHPKKGIDILIKSFSQVCEGRDFRLLIVGPDKSSQYSSYLKALVTELGLVSRVRFMGPIYGPQKWQLYRNAWAVCFPSYSEVIGLVNLEAAAVSTPVVTSYNTGLLDWEEGGGILVYPRVEDLTRALQQILSWSDSERQDRGRQLRRLVERRYSWEAVGPQWSNLYSDLLEKCI